MRFDLVVNYILLIDFFGCRSLMANVFPLFGSASSWNLGLDPGIFIARRDFGIDDAYILREFPNTRSFSILTDLAFL